MTIYKPTTKYVHVGELVAEVNVKLIIDQDEFSPCLSLDDAYRLDDVREALEQGDVYTFYKKRDVTKQE